MKKVLKLAFVAAFVAGSARAGGGIHLELLALFML